MPASRAARDRAGVVIGTWPTGLPRDGRFLVELAQHVEASGLELMFVGDHVFGNTPGADALVTLGALAAATSTVTLGTAVLLPARREPAVLAKQLASIDYLSGGRLVCGVGVGGEVASEWQAMEVSRIDRGERTDEYLALFREIWSGQEVRHAGRFRTVEGVIGSPAPVQPGGPPIWVGGRSNTALRRAVQHQGWCAYAMSPAGVRERMPVLDELLEDRRDVFDVSAVLFARADSSQSRAVQYAQGILGSRYARAFGDEISHIGVFGPKAAITEQLAGYREAGVGDLLFSIQASATEMLDQIDLLADAWRDQRS